MAAGAKKKTAFFCQECGYESAKWMGQCPSCHAWNTMVEEPVRIVSPGRSGGGLSGGSLAGTGSTAHRPVTLSDADLSEEPRISTGYSELDRVLGGGIVKGSLLLVGGDPGIGKSTLLLQVTRNLSQGGHRVLYVSGEESLRQIGLRARRIGGAGENLKFFCETDLDVITDAALAEKPEVCVIDSIQTMFNPAVAAAPGSVSQVREATGVLLRLAKEQGITIFIVGHVTKEGTVAGPRVLEQRQEGLLQVENPSEYMLAGRPLGASGSVVTCSMEGTRPLLVEVQALLNETNFGYPKRQATGTDYNRVSLLMAVMEKRLGLPLGQQDAYVNLAGGIRQSEPALDLGIALAVVSSYRNRPIDDKLMAFGEIGLSGEIRAVSQAEHRVQEAAKLGFTTVIMPRANLRGMHRPEGVEIIGVAGLGEAIDAAMG